MSRLAGRGRRYARALPRAGRRRDAGEARLWHFGAALGAGFAALFGRFDGPLRLDREMLGHRGRQQRRTLLWRAGVAGLLAVSISFLIRPCCLA